MENIQKNVLKIKSEIADTGKITLVAISKSQPIAKIRMALEAGQKHFGESYLQEALDKIKNLAGNHIIWHYIGRIQSNKTKLIAANFDWVQSVASLKTAELLNKHRPPQMDPLNICIQVNISEEPSKSGVLTSEILTLAKKIHHELPSLKLRGLMAIPAYHKKFDDQLAVFKKLALEFEKLKQNGIPVDTLSMGMSHDFEAAIAAGATMIRIGSAIFGKRD